MVISNRCTAHKTNKDTRRKRSCAWPDAFNKPKALGFFEDVNVLRWDNDIQCSYTPAVYVVFFINNYFDQSIDMSIMWRWFILFGQKSG